MSTGATEGGSGTEQLFAKLAEDLLGCGQKVRFTATGFSMLPTIRDGEKVVVAPSDPRNLAPGDIVLCRTGRGLLAHRVVRIDELDRGILLLTRGDSSDTCDSPTEASRVLGQVLAVVRDGREIPLTGPVSLLRQRIRRAVFRLRRRLHD